VIAKAFAASQAFVDAKRDNPDGGTAVRVSLRLPSWQKEGYASVTECEQAWQKVRPSGAASCTLLEDNGSKSRSFGPCHNINPNNYAIEHATCDEKTQITTWCFPGGGNDGMTTSCWKVQN
jgi:hypothetical protein